MSFEFLNFHTHSDFSEPETLAIRNLHQKDWQISSPENYEACSIGLHPWFLSLENWAADFQFLEKTVSRPNVLAIGEAGLDRAIPLDFDFQETVFERQVLLSEKIGKPMILHCVRAHERLVQLKKLWKPRQNWIVHGFDKHPQTAKMLLDAGFYLSFGAAIFRENSQAPESLKIAPPDFVFLETDDKPLTIKALYSKAAEILNVSEDRLCQKTRENFERLF